MRALGLDEREALGAVGAFVLTGTETIVSYMPRLVAMLIDTRLAAAAGRRPVARGAGDRRGAARHDAVARDAARAIAPDRDRDGDGAAGRPRHPRHVLRRTGPSASSIPRPTRRRTLKQLWFGAGAHYCIGAPLAMAQIRLTLDALLEHAVAAGGRRAGRSRGVLIPSYASLVLAGAT